MEETCISTWFKKKKYRDEQHQQFIVWPVVVIQSDTDGCVFKGVRCVAAWGEFKIKLTFLDKAGAWW